MSLFVQRTTSGIKKIGPSDYEAITDDPLFVYRFRFRRPRYMVVFLQSLDDDYLDPTIFADRGNGFANLGDGGGEVGVDENVAIGAGLENHVSADALGEQVDVVVQFGGCYRLIRRSGAALKDTVRDRL